MAHAAALSACGAAALAARRHAAARVARVRRAAYLARISAALLCAMARCGCGAAHVRARLNKALFVTYTAFMRA